VLVLATGGSSPQLHLRPRHRRRRGLHRHRLLVLSGDVRMRRDASTLAGRTWGPSTLLLRHTTRVLRLRRHAALSPVVDSKDPLSPGAHSGPRTSCARQRLTGPISIIRGNRDRYPWAISVPEAWGPSCSLLCASFPALPLLLRRCCALDRSLRMGVSSNTSTRTGALVTISVGMFPFFLDIFPRQDFCGSISSLLLLLRRRRTVGGGGVFLAGCWRPWPVLFLPSCLRLRLLPSPAAVSASTRMLALRCSADSQCACAPIHTAACH